MKKNLLITVALFSFMLNLLCLNAQWEKTNFPQDAFYITTLAINGNNIFAGTYYGGVFLSTDNGESWIEKNNGLTEKWVNCIAINSNNIFAGTYGGVFLSTDDGESWVEKNNGLTNKIVRSLAISSENIFAGTDSSGIFLSTDDGESWIEKNNGLNIKEVSCIAINGNNIFAGTYYGGIFLSTDNGESWIEKNNGLTDLFVSTIKISGNKIFAGTYGGGVFLSTDNCESWAEKNNGLTCMFVLALALVGENIFASVGSFEDAHDVFLCSNNENTWTEVSDGLYVISLAISGDYLFAGTKRKGLFRAKISDLITTSIKDVIQSEFALSIFPNPFSESTTINYELQTAGRVKIDIFNSLGEKITTLIDEWQEVGKHNEELRMNNEKLPAGMYYYRIQIGDRIESGKMVLIR